MNLWAAKLKVEMLGHLFEQLNFNITYIPESSGCSGTYIPCCEILQCEYLDSSYGLQQQQQAAGTPEHLYLKPSVSQERVACRRGKPLRS